MTSKENSRSAWYVLAISLAGWDQRVSIGIYVLVAWLWLIPDQRIEKKIGYPRTTPIGLPPMHGSRVGHKA